MQLTVGILFCVTGWLVARRAAGCRSWQPAAMLLDIAVPLAVFAFLSLGAGKPLFGGILVFSAACAFAVADMLKRKTLFEPVVCADLFTAADIFRNPRICLIFPETKWIVVGMAAAIALFAGLFQLEPSVYAAAPLLALAVPAALALVAWLIAGPLLAPATRALQSLRPTGDPIKDSALFGPFATMLVHGILGRGERQERRKAAVAAANVPIDVSSAGGPVVVVQCESFFDARRLHAGISRELVPAFDSCGSKSVQWGRLSVPSVGANSVRTEFAVLTGLPEPALGFDRFNPYQGFAREPTASLASKLRAAGYRTVCLHPFDRAFYGRDRVMGQLGFDEFIGLEGFADAEKVGLYTADVAVAHRITELIRDYGPKVFVFAITMENHGPWQNGRKDSGDNVAPGLPSVPGQPDLLKFLRSLRNADRMIRILADALHRPGGLLAFYGDHLPSFPAAFATLEFAERDTDYLIWRSDGGDGRRRDLAANELHAAILTAVIKGKTAMEAARRRTAPVPAVAERNRSSAV